MRELTKTLIFVGVAAALAFGAVAASMRPDWSGAGRAFDDLGQEFFPAFDDPMAATELEVIDFDSDTASAIPFKVMFKDGLWTIPSHHDYPADAKDRLARTAGAVMDLTKDTIRSDRAEDHEILGVIDPLDAKATTLQGRGKRITLKDESGSILADLIVGKPVPGQEKQRFVRVPGQKRTYGVVMNADLSTKFADWIETNLLKFDVTRARKIVFDNHKVDPEAGTIARGETLVLQRKDASSPWALEGLEGGAELNTTAVSSLTNALADLKIVGVRPKPAGITADLKQNGAIQLTPPARLALEAKGFYALRDGRLLSNQGDVLVSCDDGVVYVLRYGEVTFATGESLSAGGDDETAKPAEPTKQGEAEAKGEAEEKKAGGPAESRYLFVTVEFDPSLIPEPEPPADAGQVKLPDDVFARDPDDPIRKAADDAERAKLEREDAERQKRVEEGQKRAKELNERFAQWFYVTPGDSFRSIVLDRAALTRPKGTGSAESGLPPGLQMPGADRGGMLPPGHP